MGTLADQQHGVVARAQLQGLGLGKDAVQHRIASGRLHPLHAGVYAVGHRVLSKRIRRHHFLLPDDEVTVEEGIPVTTVPRTIFDLAATESVDVIKHLLRESEYRRLYDRLSLWDLIERYPGKRGVRKVRAALDELKEEPAGRRRSRLEERFGPFLRRHRLPLARFNDWILLGEKRYQVDCHWPGTNEIVELDGWEGHGTRSAFREDRTRDRRLRVAGYSITRITWAQLDDEPDQVAADLRALLMNKQSAPGQAGIRRSLPSPRTPSQDGQLLA